MANHPSVIERAFQLARSGRCATIADIRIELARENYASADVILRGGVFLNQLKVLMGTARMGRVA